MRSLLENQASRRAVSKNAAIFVRQRSLGRTNPAPTSNDLAFSLHPAGLRSDGPNKRNLEFERCLRKALVQHGLDSEPHAAIEQRCGKAAMNCAERISVPSMGLCGGNNTALRSLDDVVAERFRHRV